MLGVLSWVHTLPGSESLPRLPFGRTPSREHLELDAAGWDSDTATKGVLRPMVAAEDQEGSGPVCREDPVGAGPVSRSGPVRAPGPLLLTMSAYKRTCWPATGS